MAKFDASRGQLTVLSSTHGIEIIDVDNTSYLDAADEKHSIRLIRSRTDGVAKVADETAIMGESLPGFAWFIPASAHVFFETTPHDSTIFRLDQSIIEDVAGYRVSLNNWRTQFKPATSYLALSLRAIAMEAEEPCPILAQSARLALTAAVVREVHQVEGLRLEGGLQRRSHQRVVDYIESNMDKPITLDELAGAANMSKFAFLRAWRKATGMTPMQYVYRRRVERAKRMLITTDLPIAHITFACGFSSQSHMTNVFKNYVGETPAAYRRITSR